MNVTFIFNSNCNREEEALGIAADVQAAVRCLWDEGSLQPQPSHRVGCQPITSSVLYKGIVKALLRSELANCRVSVG